MCQVVNYKRVKSYGKFIKPSANKKRFQSQITITTGGHLHEVPTIRFLLGISDVLDCDWSLIGGGCLQEVELAHGGSTVVTQNNYCQNEIHVHVNILLLFDVVAPK